MEKKKYQEMGIDVREEQRREQRTGIERANRRCVDGDETLVSLLNPAYPGQEGGDPRVDARVVALPAPNAPRYQPHLRPHSVHKLHQGPATVPLRKIDLVKEGALDYLITFVCFEFYVLAEGLFVYVLILQILFYFTIFLFYFFTFLLCGCVTSC